MTVMTPGIQAILTARSIVIDEASSTILEKVTEGKSRVVLSCILFPLVEITSR